AEARYPPAGRRGAAYYSRAHRYTGRSGFAAIDAGDAEVAVGIQIETPSGVDRIDEILDVSGIDFVLAGPADLAVAYGRGHDTAARVDAAMAELGEACRRRGLPAIIGAASPEAAAS